MKDESGALMKLFMAAKASQMLSGSLQEVTLNPR
jgi:hypothetical protein